MAKSTELFKLIIFSKEIKKKIAYIFSADVVLFNYLNYRWFNKAFVFAKNTAFKIKI